MNENSNGEGYGEDYTDEYTDDYGDDYDAGYDDGYGGDYDAGNDGSYAGGSGRTFDDSGDGAHGGHREVKYDKLADFLSMEIDGDIDVNIIAESKDGDADAGSPGENADGGSTQAKNKTKMETYDWVQCIVGAIIVGIFIFVFIGRPIGVDGISMMQTLHDKDRVIMSNLFYTPKNGDIIVFQSPSESFGGTPLVKRVIAIEGQTIDINFECGHVYVDGILQCEPYINEPTYSRAQFQGPITVREGHVFVMGDNRNHSSDSRDSRIKEVDTRYILGKVLFVAIPGGDEYTPRDWGNFGFVGTYRNCPDGEDCVCYAVHETPLSDCSCDSVIAR